MMWKITELPLLLLLLLSVRCQAIELEKVEDDVVINLPKSLFSTEDGSTIAELVAEDPASTGHPNLEDTLHFESTLNTSIEAGLKAMKHLYEVLEPEMLCNGEILNGSHPAALLSKFSRPLVEHEEEESFEAEMKAFAALTAAKAFHKSYNLNGGNVLARQPQTHHVSLKRTALESSCPPRDNPLCLAATNRYRTHDGTCNNRRHRRWGAAQMPFNRFLPPEYDDGVDTVRSAIDGKPLASARFVSLLVHGAKEDEAPLTLLLAQWGQLLDHDITSTAQPRSINGTVPRCCGSSSFHPSCFPIKVPFDDPWLAPLKIHCLEFLRSAPAHRRDCALSWREQTNQASSFIDASPIYANSVKLAERARVFRNGFLIFGTGARGSLPGLLTDDICQRGGFAPHCIRSGDGRSGEQPGLLALHHVWVGAHNRLAAKLSSMNSHWSDEKIYQEARRIIGALFQHITYREFLPIVLGRDVVKLFDLELLREGYYNGYNPAINPTIANSFSAAAFRFGHSLVQGTFLRCDRFHNFINSNVSLHEEFELGDMGSVGSLHRLIRGMANQRVLKRDEFITPELTNHLFQTPGFPFGLDLAAINIQRGRDHGIPPYTRWRVPCGLPPVNSWEDFIKVVGPASARRIHQAYTSIHDVDLFVGGIAERPVRGGLVGPTFACIIAQQFSNLRKGDRFWYENGGFESSFTPAQLDSIRHVSLAQILCESVGGGTFQPHIFIPANLPNNKRLPCGMGPLSEMDLTPWLEQDPFELEQVLPTTLKGPLNNLVTTTFPPNRRFDFTSSPFMPTSTVTMKPSNMVTHIKSHKIGFVQRVTITKKPNIGLRDALPVVSSGVLSVQKGAASLNQVPIKINDKLDLKRPQNVNRTNLVNKVMVPAVNDRLDKIESLKSSGQQLELRTTEVLNNSSNFEAIDDLKGNNQLKGENNGKVDKTLNTNGAEEVEKDLDVNIKDKMATINSSDHESDPGNNNKLKENDNERVAEPANKSFIKISTLNNLGKRKLINQQILFPSTTENRENLLNLKENRDRGKRNDNIFQQNDIENRDKTTIEQESSYEKHLKDIDPMMHSTQKEHKRVHRRFTENLQQTNQNTSGLNSFEKQTIVNNKLRFINNIINNKTGLNRGPSKRPGHLRVTIAPKSNTTGNSTITAKNQFEISINIRHTTKKAMRPFHSITSGNNRNKPYLNYPTYYEPYDNQGSHVGNGESYTFAPTINLNSNHHHLTKGVQDQRTKPPTIIIIDEQDDHANPNHGSNRPRPGLSPNIINWSTTPITPTIISHHQPNAFPNHQNNPGAILHPLPQFPSFNGVREEDRFHSSINGRPLSPNILTEVNHFNRGDSVTSETNTFTSVSAFASSNTPLESSFNFNVKPTVNPSIPQRYSSISGGGGNLDYDYSSTWLSSYPIDDRLATVHSATPEYYDRPEIEEESTGPTPFSFGIKKKHRNRYPSNAQSVISRTINPLKVVNMVSNLEKRKKTLKRAENDEEDPQGPQLTTSLWKNYNRDGYLRPEYMFPMDASGGNNHSYHFNTNNIFVTKRSNYFAQMNQHRGREASDWQKDPLVMSFLDDKNNGSQEEFVINFDQMGKSLNKDILAINFDDEKESHETLPNEHQKEENEKNQEDGRPRFDQIIPFAPINVLTKPERPDNWVIYESSKSLPSLPEMPELSLDATSTGEVPKPFSPINWRSVKTPNNDSPNRN